MGGRYLPEALPPLAEEVPAAQEPGRVEMLRIPCGLLRNPWGVLTN